MKVLILARLTAASGNNSTACRIREHLLSGGFEVSAVCVSYFQKYHELAAYVSSNAIDFIIGIHAFRAGKLLCDCKVPYAIIFGGTDLNEHHKDKEKLFFMSKAVSKARKCVAFNNAMKQKAISFWEEAKDKVIVQPQAVEVHVSDQTYHIGANLSDWEKEVILNNNAIIFLLVASLRPVKDPFYLVETIAAWHKADNRIHLVVVGPEIDIRYSKEFKDSVTNTPGIICIDRQSPANLQSLITRAFALVNTSKSEGMAGAILEAMSLRVLVLARWNDGNASVIEHRKTGLLFTKPEEFRSLAEEALSDESLRCKLIDNAKKYICDQHSFEKERAVYCELVQSLAENEAK
ncbi:glycosyltransferase 1 domain-containing protein 1-like [Rhopilema esculentum]|uniref:glycosyltransferase 1 domain-containing protein 1-like n=1 Tax=Rhopilema esculentum TaxID=499914 RepID=UPI0031DA64BC